MSKEKQIEEMACAMCGQDKICGGVGVEKCIIYPDYRRQANRLYNAGYRKQEWISVDERLPEDNQQCIIFTKIHFIPDHVDEPDHYEGIEISRYFNGFGFSSKNGIFAKFWMPLPEPPKMKGGAEMKGDKE